MDKITQSITLDLVEISHNVVNARQGDRLTRDLIITITNNGKDYEIPESSYVYIRGKRADGESVFYSATIEGTSIVHVNIHDFLLSYSGRCKLDIGIYNRVQSESGNDSDEIASTEPFILYVPEEIFNENDIVESDEGSALSELINSARDEIQEMNELEEEISNSENNRKVNEATRQTNEQTRQTNEQTRINSENIRNSNENTRKANEVIRESQESDRQTNTATAISNAEIATKKANDAADDLQAKLDSHHFVLTEDKGSANGVAELDENGIIISSQLPSYVDDVIEGYFYNSKFYKESTHTTEITGEAGKIYIDLSTEKTYRWSGSTFVVISETLALGETSSTAYRGDRGKIAYEHSQSAHAPSNAEENQNTFSSIIVGDDVISAISKTDVLNLEAGDNITLTPNADTNKITISSDHPSISKSTDSTSTASPSAGDIFTAVDSVTRDENGHVTKINTKTITLPNTSVVVDEALSSTSTNPVQNKVVNSALEEKLPLSGGTMTGVITAKPEMHIDDYSGSLNMNNSDIYGLNSIYTSNASEGADEGIHFYRDSDHVDTLWMANGNMYFVPNRELGTYTNASNSNTVLHSGNYKTYCTPANIGAATSSHTHNYLPLSGGAMGGALTFANDTWNAVGDDVKIGDINHAGTLGVLGNNGNTAIELIDYNEYKKSGSLVGAKWTCTGNETSTISGTLSGAFNGNLSGNASTSSIPLGFSSRSGSAPWGNQTGTYVTDWNDSTGGTIQFRRDNPASGQLSAIIDGYFYQNEGNYRCLDTSDTVSSVTSSSSKVITPAGVRVNCQPVIKYTDVSFEPVLGPDPSSSSVTSNGWVSLTSTGYNKHPFSAQIIKALPQLSWEDNNVTIVDTQLNATYPQVRLRASRQQVYAIIVRFYYTDYKWNNTVDK